MDRQRRGDARRGWTASGNRGFTFACILVVGILVVPSDVIGQASDEPPARADDAVAEPPERPIRRGIVIIDGKPVGERSAGDSETDEPPTQPDGSDAPVAPETDSGAEAAEGDGGAVVVARPAPPRPLRPGEFHVTGIDVGYVDRQVRRVGMPIDEALAEAPVRVALDGDRLVPVRPDLEPIETTLGALVEVSTIWDGSIRPVLEVALESFLADAGQISEARIGSLDPAARHLANPSDPTRATLRAMVEIGPFPVDELEVVYAVEHPEHPDIEGLLDVEITFGVVDDDRGRHLVGLGPRRESVTLRLRDLGSEGANSIYNGAMGLLVRAVRDALVAEDLVGVFVTVDPRQVEPETLRILSRDRSLRLLLFTGIVREVRTLAFGERIEAEDRRNHPSHARIAAGSPIRPWVAPAPPADSAADSPATPAANPAASPAANPPAEPATEPRADLVETPPADGDAEATESSDATEAAESADASTAVAPAVDPAPPVPVGPRRDLIRKTQLERYLSRLNRFPGRRVDVALSAHEDGGAVLDYLVAERRPLLLYSQVANTGTEQTDRWRTRVGLNLTQVTDNDDLFSLEYVTAGFSESHTLNAVYESRVGSMDDLRWQVAGTWSEFTASDVGFANEEFVGDSWSTSVELALNVAQWGDAFLDLYAGARFQSIFVDNRLVQIDGQTQLFLPRLGARFERSVQTATTNAFVHVEFNLPNFAGTADDDLNRLGRLFVDDDWTALQWGVQHNMYLEPVLNRAAWKDLSTRESSTLAHELQLSFRGQYVFGSRLIPQAEQVVGGMYSVRGYPESVVAGDDVYIASAEYRLHIPRSFGFSDEAGELFGESFRWMPQEPYGEADWDLVLKGFVDVGWARINDPLFFEESARLLGAGLGVEFAYKKNVLLRLDWGTVLEPIDAAEVSSGDDRVHFSATILF